MLIGSLALLLTCGSARAQELVRTLQVNPPEFGGTARPVTAGPIVALPSILWAAPDGPQVVIVDLAEPFWWTARISREALLPFGTGGRSPHGEVAWYGPGPSGAGPWGLVLSNRGSAGPTTYVEMDQDGAIRRSADLGAIAGPNAWVHPLAADADRVWFWTERYADPLPHARGPTEVVVSTLDLRTLEVTVRATQPLSSRPLKAYEDRLWVNLSRDRSKVAIVEYTERRVAVAPPPARVYVVDLTARSSFFVDAPSTAYGVAFSVDSRFLYLASSELATVSRVNVAERRIDLTVPCTGGADTLVVSPSGRWLFVVGHAAEYAVYELPDLKRRKNRPMPWPEVDPRHSVASADGTHLLIDRSPPLVRNADGTYAVAKGEQRTWWVLRVLEP